VRRTELSVLGKTPSLDALRTSSKFGEQGTLHGAPGCIPRTTCRIRWLVPRPRSLLYCRAHAVAYLYQLHPDYDSASCDRAGVLAETVSTSSLPPNHSLAPAIMPADAYKRHTEIPTEFLLAVFAATSARVLRKTLLHVA
jgi:hypothetical protein